MVDENTTMPRADLRAHLGRLSTLPVDGSPYAHTISGVCETLPAATDQEVRRAQRLAQAGPPTEAVGLQPFTLTVPPRRSEGDR